MRIPHARVIAPIFIAAIFATGLAAGSVWAQNDAPSIAVKGLERLNPSIWSKGKFTEVEVLTGSHKMLYFAGMTPNDENQTSNVLVAKDMYGQCAYEYARIKKILASQGATLANVVKSTVYLTDKGPEARADLRKCRSEAYGAIPQPADTMVFVAGLAGADQLIEVDITAAVPN